MRAGFVTDLDQPCLALGQRRGGPVDHRPPQATVAEPGADPFHRPAQLLPSAGLGLEGRELPRGGVREAVEGEGEGRDLRFFLLAGTPPQAGLETGEQQARDPVRVGAGLGEGKVDGQ